MSTPITTPKEIASWQDLRAAVENHHGVFRIRMEVLRQLEGRQRVGKHILSSIEEKLTTLGLGHLPKELPNRQQQNVLLYRVGTPASVLVDAVREGLTESPSSQAYDILVRLNTLPDPADVISKEEIQDTAQELLPAVLKLLRSTGAEPSTVSAITPQRKPADVVDLTTLLAK